MRQMQEALTPSHLKKAKLMFFFTRYPSSTLLKTYFLDVQVKRRFWALLLARAPTRHDQQPALLGRGCSYVPLPCWQGQGDGIPLSVGCPGADLG